MAVYVGAIVGHNPIFPCLLDRLLQKQLACHGSKHISFHEFKGLEPAKRATSSSKTTSSRQRTTDANPQASLTVNVSNVLSVILFVRMSSFSISSVSFVVIEPNYRRPPPPP
jgi:hypothetical protein